MLVPSATLQENTIFPAPHAAGLRIWLVPSPSNRDSFLPSRPNFHSRFPSLVRRFPSTVQLKPLRVFVERSGTGSEACLPEPLRIFKVSLDLVSIAARLLPSADAVREWYELASRVMGCNSFPCADTIPICEPLTNIPRPSCDQPNSPTPLPWKKA